MRRRVAMFLTGSLLVHAGLGAGGVWLARHARAAERRQPQPVFTGETFDLATTEDRPAPSPSVVAAPETQPSAADPLAATSTGPAARAQRDDRERSMLAAARGDRDPSSASHVEVPLTFGALGDRSATSLIVAVARGFPQAASTDPTWRTVAFGEAGEATLAIDLESDGTLARWSLGPGASPALRQAMVRTMAFIGGRSFVARGAVTKLRLSARVSADAVRDGSDAVYALHSEHEGDEASAFFSLSSGRRIDLVITAVK